MNSRFLAAATFASGLLLATPAALAADTVRGEAVYRQHCARCHGAGGESQWPGAPNLARREGLMQTDQVLLRSLRAGRGAKPGYQGILSDADLLNVIAYSRTLAR